MKPIIDTLINEVPKKVDVAKITEAAYWDDLLERFLNFIPTIIFAFILLYVGFKAANIIVKIIQKIMRRHLCDESVIGFMTTTVSVILKIIVLMSFVGVLGIETSAFVAMLGAAGLAVGLALQGTLQNFAGGVVILVLKPFRVNDLVEFGGHKGIVKDIKIFNTVIDKLTTNETVIVPNSIIASSTLINWKGERERRLELAFSVAYGENIEEVRRIVLSMAYEDKRVLRTTAPAVIVTALADSSVNMELRVWVDPNDVVFVSSDMLERIYDVLNQHNISIPFPQLDVQIKK